MSDLHTNGTADRAPAGVQDDIVEQLEWHTTCVRNADGLCLLQQALYKIEHQQAEIERLRAECDDLQVLLRGRTAEFQAEIERLRAAGDALAEVVAWWGDGTTTGDAVLAAWEEARYG